MEKTDKRERLINAAVAVSVIFAIAFAAYFMFPVAMTIGHY